MEDFGTLAARASLLRMKLAESLPGEQDSGLTSLGGQLVPLGAAAAGIGHFGQQGIEHGLQFGMNKGWVPHVPGVGPRASLAAVRAAPGMFSEGAQAIAKSHGWLGEHGGKMTRGGLGALGAGGLMYLAGSALDKSRARDTITGLRNQVEAVHTTTPELRVPERTRVMQALKSKLTSGLGNWWHSLQARYSNAGGGQ